MEWWVSSDVGPGLNDLMQNEATARRVDVSKVLTANLTAKRAEISGNRRTRQHDGELYLEHNKTQRNQADGGTPNYEPEGRMFESCRAHHLPAFFQAVAAVSPKALDELNCPVCPEVCPLFATRAFSMASRSVLSCGWT
jgi:hypothetical protein